MFYSLKLYLELFYDWIRGFKYYTIGSGLERVDIQAGRYVKIEKRKGFPWKDRVLGIHKSIGDVHVILDVQHINFHNKWVLMRVKKKGF